VDACCDSEGANAQLPDFWFAPPGRLLLREGCLKEDWAHKSVYCNPDFHQISDILDHYLTCFQRAPNNTRAIFILPDWPGTRWFQEMWCNPDFMLVSYFPAGSHLFTAPGLHQREARRPMGPTRWGVMVVLHDQIRPNIPLIPTPASGFWPPVPPPTTPVASLATPSQTAAAADYDNGRVQQLADTILQPSIADLILRHPDIFAAHDADLGTFNRVYHRIDTGSCLPIKAKLRRTAPGDAQAIEETVHTLLHARVIRPSYSPWLSRPLVVPKPNGDKRLVVDYRPLNTATTGDAYVMPRADDIFDSIGEAAVFTVIDLKAGFHQIPVWEPDIPKTAFATPIGNFEYTKMPFGLKGAPATFQRVMDDILGPALRGFTKVYLDDLLIYSGTLQEHCLHLECVFLALRQAGLKANPDKCTFAADSCKYLGHIVSADGIRPNPAKVDAISRLAPPTDVSQLRSFLGLTSYYRRFVHGYAKIASPLNALLTKDCEFVWTPACQAAFATLISGIVDNAVLARPDHSRPFIIQVDWSAEAVGAVLSQIHDGVERPVSFQSRSLGAAEKNYSPTEGEALAAVWGISVFRPYVQGRHFTLQTDCSALTWLKDHVDPPPKLARWLMKLSEFTFDICHRPGKKNANADALSRLPPAGSPPPSAVMERPFLPHEVFLARDAPLYDRACMAIDSPPSASGSPSDKVHYGPAGARHIEEGGSEDTPDFLGNFLGKRSFPAEGSEQGQGLAAKRRRLSRAVASPAKATSPDSEQRSLSVPADATCVVCNKEGDPSILLVCDNCQNMTHTTCECPPLTRVPTGPWECSICNPPKASRFSGPADVLQDKPVMEFLLRGKCNVDRGDNLRRIKRRHAGLLGQLPGQTQFPCRGQ